MSLSQKQREELREEFKNKYHLGSDSMTEEVTDYWLSKIDSLLQEREKEIEMIESKKVHYSFEHDSDTLIARSQGYNEGIDRVLKILKGNN